MNNTASKANSPKQLKRELGFIGTIIMGLSSMIGTGVFVSIGIAAGISNSGVIIAVILAGLLAICNSLNMAQLAANHSVSGGVYEYGYKYLTPWLSFTGGWMYLLAKIASSATAAVANIYQIGIRFVGLARCFETHPTSRVAARENIAPLVVKVISAKGKGDQTPTVMVANPFVITFDF